MRWTLKARGQSLCAALPGGPHLYRTMQRRMGTLGPDPFRRLPQHAAMVRGLRRLGVDLRGARCLEVGTGHMPIAPVAFFLLGAQTITTVDLHRRLDLDMTRRMLARLAEERIRLEALYGELIHPAEFRQRLTLVGELSSRPWDLFEAIGLRYVAPGDAAQLDLPDASVDVHFSMTVLEHVEPSPLVAVLAEARRVLAPKGVAAHFVDPSDHFAHQDPSITRINFLRFSESEWQRQAGNEFSYANRLRASELARAFMDAGLRIEHIDAVVDDRSVQALRDGFPLAEPFSRFATDDLCTTTWRAYARPA